MVEASSSMKNILVLGALGAGKSTILSGLLGKAGTFKFHDSTAGVT